VEITIRRFDNCCKYLGVLIQQKFGKADINLNEIDGEFIREFEMFLKIERGCQQNTVIRYMKCFKKIINLAIANEWMTKNPFAGIKFQAKEVIKEVLTKEEIERIMAKQFDMERLEYVRDVFIFCCFSGLAYVDVNNLKAEHLKSAFSEKMALALLYRLERATVELVTIQKQVMELTEEFEKKYSVK
jgi:site-specific recombinase XerD